ncbi:hypothetical protein [Pseudogemmobacter sonorensis]|uniref:hypothetical protein n=1 Tax=Pseudogemmobacter sonorensis TaxID=2989681 RepID=UPI00369CF157
MRRIPLLLAALLGMTGCVRPANDAGLCIAAAPDVAALRRALLDHPETPDPVGEAGADLVIGFEAVCRA